MDVHGRPLPAPRPIATACMDQQPPPGIRHALSSSPFFSCSLLGTQPTCTHSEALLASTCIPGNNGGDDGAVLTATDLEAWMDHGSSSLGVGRLVQCRIEWEKRDLALDMVGSTPSPCPVLTLPAVLLFSLDFSNNNWLYIFFIL